MEVVNAESEPLIQGKRGRKAIYPWDEWLRHNVTVRLVEGQDFTCKIHSLRQQAFNQTTNRHGTLKTHVGTDAAGRTVLELTFSFTAAYFRKLEQTRIEGDRAMGIHSEPIRTGIKPLDDDDMEIDVPSHREIADNEIDNPVARNGKKWGPPSID